MPRLTFSVGLAIACISCSQSFGIVRQIPLAANPDLDCAEYAIGKIPETTHLLRSVDNRGGRQITFRGLMPHDRVSYFRYQTANGSYGWLYFNATGSGDHLFVNGFTKDLHNDNCTEEDIADGRALIKKIELELTSTCSISIDELKVRESDSLSRRCRKPTKEM